MKRFSAKGNVLFLILLAVALFAALSYAVTQSNRSGGKNISDEDARLIASRIIQASTQVRQAVERLRLINGCKPNQISYLYVPNSATGFHSADAPADKSCHVFDPAGGGVSIALVENSWLLEGTPGYGSPVWQFTNLNGLSSNEIVNVGTNGGTETVLQINWLKPEICKALNRILQTNLSDILPEDDSAIIGDDDPSYAGLWDFCRYALTGGGDDNYQYNAVLIAR